MSRLDPRASGPSTGSHPPAAINEPKVWRLMPLGRGGMTDDGILIIVPRADAHVDLAAARASIAISVELVGPGRKAPVLVDFRDLPPTVPEARRYFAQSPDIIRIHNRMAALVGNRVSRFIGNTYLSVYRPPLETRLFTDFEAAMAWLRGAL